MKPEEASMASRKKTGKTKTASKIAEKAMPGWKAVPQKEEQLMGLRDVSVPADVVLPPLSVLREKYLGKKAAASDAIEESNTKDTTEVVTMAAGPLRKKVGIKGGKVIWSQG
jgi:hypothetical protein